MKTCWLRIRAEWKRAFATAEGAPLEPEAQELLQRIAHQVVRRRLEAPVLAALAGCEPLAFLSSQTLVGLAPFLETFVDPQRYRQLCVILARRDGVRAFMKAIEDEMKQQA